MVVENTLLKVGHPMTDDAAKLDQDKKGFTNFLTQHLGRKKLLVIEMRAMKRAFWKISQSMLP